jgi:hypothetical protein
MEINNKMKPQKILKISLLALLLVIIGLYFHSRMTMKEVSFIDQIYSNDEASKQEYLTRTIPIKSKTTEGSQMEIYFDKTSGNTKIIAVSYAGETFQRTDKFYFEDENNFLLVEEYNQWDRPFSVDGRNQIKHEVNKFYFNKLKMIEWKNSQNQSVFPWSSNFKNKELEILNNLDYLFSAIKESK